MRRDAPNHTNQKQTQFTFKSHNLLIIFKFADKKRKLSKALSYLPGNLGIYQLM